MKPAPTRPLPPAKPAATVVPAATLVARPVSSPAPKPVISVAEAQAAASSGLAPQSEIDDAARISAAPAAKALSMTPPAVTKITPPAPPAPKPPVAPTPVSATRPVFVGAPEGPVGSFGGGTASAPAPARETPIIPVPEIIPSSPPHKAEELFQKPAGPTQSAKPASATDSPVVSKPSAAPSFTFGGTNTAEESGGGSKKILLGVAAAALVAKAGLYVGWSHFQGRASQPASQLPAVSTPSTATLNSAQPAPPKPAASHTCAQFASRCALPTTIDAQPTETSGTSETAKEESTPAEARTPPTNSVSPTSKSASSAKPAATPPRCERSARLRRFDRSLQLRILQLQASLGWRQPARVERSRTWSTVFRLGPEPVLQKVNISQGVSQGLLMRRKFSRSIPGLPHDDAR